MSHKKQTHSTHTIGGTLHFQIPNSCFDTTTQEITPAKSGYHVYAIIKKSIGASLKNIQNKTIGIIHAMA